MAHSPHNARSAAFYAAVTVAVLCVCGIGVIAIRALTSQGSRATASGDADDAFGTGRNDDIRDQAGAAKGLHIQVMDRDDRSRLAAELQSETIEPQQAQRYRVGRPRATIYLDDGRIARITADSGLLMMPDRSKAPESGTLSDNVVVRMFDAGTSPALVAADRATPSLTWTGSSLTFDSTLGEASTNQEFTVTSAQFEFRASDARMLINQTLERLERFTVRNGGTLVYYGAPDDEPAATGEAPPQDAAPSDRAEGARTAQAGETAPVAEAPREPVTTLYRAEMRSAIRLEHAGRHVESDRLDLFARTIDNKLPPNAIAQIGAADQDGAATPDAGDQGPGRTAEADGAKRAGEPDAEGVTASAEQEDAQPAPDDGRTTLTWAGALEVRPMNDEPPELRTNHVVARFTAQESGVVRFADTGAADASGQAASVEYAMTTQDLVLSGPAQESNVVLTSGSMGEVSMGRLELSLTDGRARIPGPGTQIGQDGSRVGWRDEANLVLAMLDGRMTGELLRATCAGGARASQGESWIEAASLDLAFDTEIDGVSRPARLTATGAVRASDGRGAHGEDWDLLEVTFAPDEADPVPTSVDASGGGTFRDPTGRVDAEHLHAQLRPAEDGDTEVARVWADGDVSFTRYADQIEITADRLFADVDGELLEVEREGSEARIARGETVITGERVRLDGRQRTAEVHGPGSFEHRASRDEGAAHVVANWDEGMAFDDLAGRLECLGDVRAVHEPDALTRETITAAILRVELAPASETEIADAGEDALALDAGAEGDREILSVYAAGEAYLGLGDGLATIESATVAAPQTEGETPRVERAFRISGVEILADNREQTLDVPGRGRLFVADLRETPGGEDSSAERGAALFDWLGSLHADRALGSAEMLEGVQMSHTDASSGSKTVLESARLLATFTPSESEEHLFGGLRSAIAQTAVYLRTDTRELTGDLLRYEPDSGVAEALAEFGRRVEILDRASGAPMTASAVRWDLRADRVDIVDPGSITIPR